MAGTTNDAYIHSRGTIFEWKIQLMDYGIWNRGILLGLYLPYAHAFTP